MIAITCTDHDRRGQPCPPTRPYDQDRCRWGEDIRPGRGPSEPAGVRRHAPARRSRAGAGLLRRVVELVRLVDTAEFYGPGTSEELIAEALWPYPDGLVIATKG